MHEDGEAGVGVSRGWQVTPARVTTNTVAEATLIKRGLDRGYRPVSRGE